MDKNPHEVIITLKAKGLPAGWKALLKELGCRRSTRETNEFPIWWRIDGNGFTLWVSEIRLSDAASHPPTWKLKLERLATLPPPGIEMWAITLTAIQQFLQDENIPFVTSGE